MRARLRLFLSVRGFDEAAPSAYAQALRANHIPYGFAPVAERLLNRPPKWADYVERLRRMLPEAELTVWTYERYASDAAGVMAAYCGFDPGPLALSVRPESTLTPPAAAVAEAERIDPGLPMGERQRIVAAIYTEHAARGGEKYNPLSAEQRACLRAAYLADLDRLLGLLAPGSLLEAPRP